MSIEVNQPSFWVAIEDLDNASSFETFCIRCFVGGMFGVETAFEIWGGTALWPLHLLRAGLWM
jgi:hypothetical protein